MPKKKKRTKSAVSVNRVLTYAAMLALIVERGRSKVTEGEIINLFLDEEGFTASNSTKKEANNKIRQFVSITKRKRRSRRGGGSTFTFFFIGKLDFEVTVWF